MHISNSISGIKMISNKHDEMEWNEEYLSTNILIYYTHETEQYAASYDALKTAR